jgi:hypothetical protein
MMLEIAVDFNFTFEAKQFILSVEELQIMHDFRREVDCVYQTCTETTCCLNTSGRVYKK